MPPIETFTEDPRITEDKFPELNRKLDSMRNAGMRVTNQWRVMWQVALRYTWSQQLDSNQFKLKDNWDYIVINKIYPLMMQNIAKLAKNDPKVMTFPWNVEAGLTQYVEQWAGVLQYLWQSHYELGMRLKLILGLLDGGVYGYMVGKTFWDPRLRFDRDSQRYLGNVRHEFVHPALFWSDPTAERIDKDSCQSCGTRRKVTLEWAQKRWPDFEDEIKKSAFTANDTRFFEDSILGYRSDYPGAEPVVYENQRGSTLTLPRKVVSYIAQLIEGNAFNLTGVPQDTVRDQQYVFVEETYFQDQEDKPFKVEENLTAEQIQQQGLGDISVEDGSVIDPKTKEPFTVEDWPKEVKEDRRVPKFANGRAVLRIGRTILNPEEEDQEYRESRWPFTIMPYNILPHMWQGTPAAELARNANDMLNLSVSSLIQRARLAADPERLVEAGALSKDRRGNLRQTRQQMKGIGKWIIMAKGKLDKMKNIVYAPLDPGEIGLVQVLAQSINDTMMMQPVARGAPQGVAGGKGAKITATEAAKQDVNSHDYTAMQAIFLDQWIDQTLTIVAELVQRHYQPERITRVIGGGKRENLIVTQQHLDVKFDVNIEPGSTLPFDKEAKKQEHIQAYQILENPNPNPMLEQVLRDLSVSDVEKILQQHQGTTLFKQFAQLSAQMTQLDPEAIQQLVEQVPELGPVVQLMTQMAQLVPQEQQQPQAQKQGA